MRSWVKYLIAAIILVAIVVLGAIFIPHAVSVKNKEPDTAGNDISVGHVTHNYDIPEVVDDHSDMTADDVKKIYFEASKFYLDWVELKMSLPYVTVENGGYDSINVDMGTYETCFYCLDTSVSKYKSVDEIKAACREYFTDGKCEEYLKQIDNEYIIKGDKIYCYDKEYGISGGADFTYDITVDYVEDDICGFTVLEYESYGNGESYEKGPYHYTMKYIDGRWKFTDDFKCAISF